MRVFLQLNLFRFISVQDHDIAAFPYDGDEDDDDFEQLVRESEDLEPDAPLLY